MGIGKSLKKVVKKVTKVATLGAIDGKDGGWLGGTGGVLNVLSAGALGDGPIKGFANTGAGLASMAESNQALANMQSQFAEKQAILSRNQGVDLNASNVADIQAGGSADSATEAAKKRRKLGSGLASQLGIV